LIEIYAQQEKYLRDTYDRSLPFQDGLFDRFERVKRLGFGEDSSIYNSALLFGSVQAGKKVWIGPYVILDGSGGGIKIGDFYELSAGVHIYTHDTFMRVFSGWMESVYKAAVKIGNNTYIGSQSVIKAGINIGANTFVNKNTEDYSIIGGSPGKLIGKVVIKNEKITLEYFEKNDHAYGDYLPTIRKEIKKW